jgi:hypothetical protein
VYCGESGKYSSARTGLRALMLAGVIADSLRIQSRLESFEFLVKVETASL